MARLLVADNENEENELEGESARKLIETIYANRQELSKLKNKLCGSLSKDFTGPMARMKFIDLLTVIANLANME